LKIVNYFNLVHVLIKVMCLTLAAAAEDNILSYEPVITQECEFCSLFAVYYALLLHPFYSGCIWL